MSRARKIVLPVLELTRVCDANAEGAIKQVISATDVSPERIYYTHPKSLIANEGQQKFDWVDYSYNLFPVVLDRDGRPWDAAMAYLFWKIDGRALANMSTFHCIADDLACYLDFCQDPEHKIDYTDFPQNKLKRPTYRYHGHLKRQVFAEKIAVTTASRRMGSVIGFYRWLQTEGRLVTAHPTWNEKDVYLSFKDARGFSKTMTVQTTDVSVKVPKNEDPYSNTIDDGGKLRPLNEAEQLWLFEALVSLGNPEMLLIHAFMVYTGARIQTALTLKVKHARRTTVSGKEEMRLKIGSGTGIDSKYDKQMILHIPVWLYEKMRVYSHSDRAILRRERAEGGDTEDQYLFLTQQGSPYYESKSTSTVFNSSINIRHQKRGQTVRAFVTDRIIPWVQSRYEKDWHYRMHDLRATYGMNLTDIQLELVKAGKITLSMAREFVRARMGHKSSATTDLYLNFRRHQEMIYAAVDRHEDHLKELIERAWNGRFGDD